MAERPYGALEHDPAAGMTSPVDPNVLRRKIAAHRRPPVALPDPAPQAARAITRALRHAATPFEGLGLLPADPALGTVCDLDQALQALPDQGLLAVVEDGKGLRGLIALGAGLVDALVEVQTTGRVEPSEMTPRPVTRIDEALVRDFVDLTLAALGRETAGLAGRDWPARLSYASRIRDRGQVNLLLPDRDYRVLSAGLGFDGVARRARMALVLPVEAEPVPGAAPDAPRPVDQTWAAARSRMLDGLELPLEAVLLRLRRPLVEVQAMAVGDLLRFDPADLLTVTLEAAGERALAQGRLGQKGGRRALCLAGRGAAPPQAEPAPDPAPTPRSVPELNPLPPGLAAP